MTDSNSSTLSDLEMVKACAEAMGAVDVRESELVPGVCMANFSKDRNDTRRYDPLHDDAQAMALVKRFKVSCTFFAAGVLDNSVDIFYCADDELGEHAEGSDLSRAIVTCVARMHLATKRPPGRGGGLAARCHLDCSSLASPDGCWTIGEASGARACPTCLLIFLACSAFAA